MSFQPERSTHAPKKQAIAMMKSMKLIAHFVWITALACTLTAEEATPASAIAVHNDFKVERLYSVPREQGSWVAFCFDDKGRIYASDQGPRLFRITPPGAGSGAVAKVELVSDQWGFSQGMAFINGALYLIQHGDHHEERFRPDLLLRLTDTNADDRLDHAERLIEFPKATGDGANWYEHSYHAVVPGPDGKSLYIVSGDRNGLPCEKGLTPRHSNRDSWDFAYTKEPYSGGWVARTDLNGKNMEYLCMGLRNSYDLAFNRSGDLFTYDSDLENDIGLPNYRPTAIRQILSGTDSGWAGRAGEMLWSWPAMWEDVQPPLKNIGPGSPTGVAFGYGARFPAAYQNALFACDWSYGRMFAVHLKARGASYEAEPEPFLSAQGLPIADVAVSPADGALYFLTGGRGTLSGLYRVTYSGSENTAPAEIKPDPASTQARQRRLRLETFHGAVNPAAIDELWPHLAAEDRAIRAAARIALEWQPVGQWRQRALDEPGPRTALQALLALARSTDGDTTIQPVLLAALERLDFNRLGHDEQCWYLRILTISATRHGRYTGPVAAKLMARLGPALPSTDRRVNEELVAMMAALKSPAFVKPAVELFEQSRTQEEQVYYAQALTSSSQNPGWSADLRQRFFEAVLQLVPRWKGGATAIAMRGRTLHLATEMLSPEQRSKFAAQIAAAARPAPVIPPTTRKFVRQWKLDDFAAGLQAGLKGNRDLANGRRLFTEAACIVCHNFQGEGGLGGPDLTSAGGRYSPVDLLDNILNPDKVINEQYSLMIYSMKNGTTIIGRTVNMAGDTVMVATNPNDPGGSEVRFRTSELVSTAPAKTSHMPAGLLDSLSRDEVLDLLAYIMQRTGTRGD